MNRVIRSDKSVTLLLLLWSHKCDFGAEPRSRIVIATSAVKGLRTRVHVLRKCYVLKKFNRIQSSRQHFLW
jgi:hypothetical protein